MLESKQKSRGSRTVAQVLPTLFGVVVQIIVGSVIKMNKKFAGLIAALSFVGLGASTAHATVIDDFEDGSLSEYSSSAGSVAGTAVVNGGHAHDGSFGVGMGDGLGLGNDWIYRTDITVSEGDTLSWWVKLGETGRAYLGFGADVGGTQSFVLASNSGDIRFQNNFGWGFTELDTSAQAFLLDHWYLAEVVWGLGGSVIGNLYDSDGTTLLNSVSSTVSYSSTGGIALRGFSAVSFDSVAYSGTVPEPASLALIGLGLAGLGFSRKKRAL